MRSCPVSSPAPRTSNLRADCYGVTIGKCGSVASNSPTKRARIAAEARAATVYRSYLFAILLQQFTSLLKECLEVLGRFWRRSVACRFDRQVYGNEREFTRTRPRPRVACGPLEMLVAKPTLASVRRRPSCGWFGRRLRSGCIRARLVAGLALAASSCRWPRGTSGRLICPSQGRKRRAEVPTG